MPISNFGFAEIIPKKAFVAKIPSIDIFRFIQIHSSLWVLDRRWLIHDLGLRGLVFESGVCKFYQLVRCHHFDIKHQSFEQMLRFLQHTLSHFSLILRRPHSRYYFLMINMASELRCILTSSLLFLWYCLFTLLYLTVHYWGFSLRVLLPLGAWVNAFPKETNYATSFAP